MSRRNVSFTSPRVNAISPHASSATAASRTAGTRWLDLDALADVTIVAAGRRAPRNSHTWLADCPGEQLIEIRFRHPMSVSRVRVVSCETDQSRTQEITIWASLRRGERHREVLRQQFNFSPGEATEQVEEYALQLEEVSALHVRIVPCVNGRRAVARVSELRVASEEG